MIVTEMVLINGKQFTRTYSDTNKYIECDGARYSEAFDLAGLNKEYVETDVAIDDDCMNIPEDTGVSE